MRSKRRKESACPERGFEPSAPGGRCSEGRIGRNREYCKQQRSKTTIFQPALWMRVQRADGGVASGLLLFTATPQSIRLAAYCQLPGRGAFWSVQVRHNKPALKGDSSRARPVGDAARGESGGIGSIASGSEARRPYSNQRCGCECNEQTKGEQLGAAKCRKLFPFSQTFGLPAPWPGSILVQYKLPH